MQTRQIVFYELVGNTGKKFPTMREGLAKVSFNGMFKVKVRITCYAHPDGS